MSEEQRSGTLRAIFDHMFMAKQTKADKEGYKLKHGRGEDVNEKIFIEGDVGGHKAYAAAGVAVGKPDATGYSS